MADDDVQLEPVEGNPFARSGFSPTLPAGWSLDQVDHDPFVETAPSGRPRITVAPGAPQRDEVVPSPVIQAKGSTTQLGAPWADF